MTTLVLYFLLLTGIVIYFIRPQFFFLYWLSIQPYILPAFFILFGDNMMPMDDNFLPNLYFHYPQTLCGLMLLLFCVPYLRVPENRELLIVVKMPILLLILFLIIQNFLVGFRPVSLYANIIDILWNIAPFLLLLIDKNVRPSRDSFIHYIIIFVLVQLLFSIFNLVGFKIYGEYSGIFDDSLICGTFARYNHMTNYLSIFFFVLTYEYYECKRLTVKTYYSILFLSGLLIAISGSRMASFLFVFTFLFFFCVSHGKKVVALTCLGGIFLLGTFVMGNDTFWGQDADEGTGLERNMIGIINLANSDDLSEGSTLSMSAYVLLTHFNSPLIGNGKAYRPEHYYGHPTDTYNNEGIFRTDARLAFMLVEYGIIGLLLFFLLYSSLFKGCYFYSEESNKFLYVGSFIYFFLFSLTDNGFCDYVVFSVPFIYAFSVKGDKKENVVSDLN